MEKKSYQLYTLFARVVAIAWSQLQLVIFWGMQLLWKMVQNYMGPYLNSKLYGTLP